MYIENQNLFQTGPGDSAFLGPYQNWNLFQTNCEMFLTNTVAIQILDIQITGPFEYFLTW